MLRANQLDVDLAFVLVIDLQEKLLPLIGDKDRVIAACNTLARGARIFDLPVVVTEQYAKGIGPTHAAVWTDLQACQPQRLDKSTFSAWAESSVREAILAIDRPQVILIGIEAHVCVQQTALDLVSRDYDVFVCADAVGSRRNMDYDAALSRMRQEGVWVTTVESVLFELCGRCDTPRFKEMIEIIKATLAG